MKYSPRYYELRNELQQAKSHFDIDRIVNAIIHIDNEEAILLRGMATQHRQFIDLMNTIEEQHRDNPSIIHTAIVIEVNKIRTLKFSKP
jgi:hypothetical protein